MTKAEIFRTLKKEGFLESCHISDRNLILLSHPIVEYGFVYNIEKDTFTLVDKETGKCQEESTSDKNPVN